MPSVAIKFWELMAHPATALMEDCSLAWTDHALAWFEENNMPQPRIDDAIPTSDECFVVNFADEAQMMLFKLRWL